MTHQPELLATIREKLECISRMKTMPDHKMNTFTLIAAHTLADDALTALNRLFEMQKEQGE